MREIRLWDKHEHRMIYADEAKDSANLLAIGLHGLPVAVDSASFKDGESVGWNVDHRFIDMEWTGATDNHGRKIYKDDILEAKDYWGKQDYAVVVWNDEQLQWWLTRNGALYEPLRTPFADGHMVFEIVGNLHENSDLLEASNHGTQ